MLVGYIDHLYQLRERLGEGLHGEVFQVLGPDGIVGLKLLKKEVPGLTPEEHIALFKFEFSLLKGLSHPNIIQIRDFGYDSNLDRFYYTQEWVQGKNLEELPSYWPLPRLQKLFWQALQGLAYLHRQSVLHGDLSPRNLLVVGQENEDPTLKIIDFGLSRRLISGGTPACIPPEKILKEPTDARSDLYSLGVVFYSLFTGGNPFLRKTLPATFRAHLKFVPPAATVLRPELDPVWSRLLDWMLQKNPRNRVDSAETCLEFLESHGNRVPAGRRHLQKAWIDRGGILKQALHFLDEVASEGKPRALLLLGAEGLGQAELMTELKYEAELRGIRVRRDRELRAKGPSLRMLSVAAANSIEGEDFGAESLVLAAPLSQRGALTKKLRRLSPQVLLLKPLSLPVLKKFLQRVTGQSQIPSHLLKAIRSLTRGRSETLYQVLQRLSEDPLLVDSAGRWELGIFEEMPGLLEDRLFGESLPSPIWTPELRMDPKMQWLLSFNQARTWAREEKFDKALARLKSLEKDLPRVFSKKNGSLLLNRYFALLMKAYGWIYSKQGRLAEAREAFSAGLARLREDSDQDQIQGIRLRNYLAYLDMQEGRHQQAIRIFLHTRQQAEALGAQAKKLIGNNELGAAYLAAGEHRGAIACLEEDWDSLGAKGNGQLKMKIAYSLGGAYAKIENYREARRAYERVVELARGERNWDFLYRALNGLGNVAKLQRRLEEALDYYKRSLSLAEYRGDFLSAAIVSQNRGAILSEMERLNEALRDLELSRQLTNKAPHSFQTRCLLSRTCQELGNVYQKMGDLEQAKIYFSEARNRSQEEGLKDFRLYPLLSLAELALREGKWQAFRDYHAEAAHWADTADKRQKLQELEARKAIHAKLLAETAIPHPAGTDFNREEALWNILEINHALLEETEPVYLLKRILRCAAELSGAETVLLLEGWEEGPWKLLESYGAEPAASHLEFACHVARKAQAAGQASRAGNAAMEEPFRRDPAVHELNLRSLACLPVKVPDKLEIALYFSHRYKGGLFDDAKLRLMEAFADQAALALKDAPHPLPRPASDSHAREYSRLS